MVPPIASVSSYLSNDGKFKAMASGGFLTSGEPISSSAITTVQLAVPPRISGPYEGIQVTSLPASMAAWATTCPLNKMPCPPNPAMMISFCICHFAFFKIRYPEFPLRPLSKYRKSEILTFNLRHARCDLVIAKRIGRHHVLFHELQRLDGRHAPVCGARRKQFDHREAQSAYLGFERQSNSLLCKANVLRVMQGAAHNVSCPVEGCQHFRHTDRITLGLHIAPVWRRGCLHAGQCGGGHLPAGHPEVGVIDKDHGQVLAAGRRMDDLAHADRSQVTIALIVN